MIQYIRAWEAFERSYTGVHAMQCTGNYGTELGEGQEGWRDYKSFMAFG